MNVGASTSNIASLRERFEGSSPDPLKTATEEFEGMFISYLLKVMRSTVESAEGDASLSMGKDLYSDMFDNEIALNIARTRGLGIGELIYRQLEERGEPQKIAADHVDQKIPVPIETQAAAGPAGPAGLSIPVEGRLSSDYGFRKDPLTGASKFHEGIDIAASAGTPFKATAPGKVIFAGPLNGYGNTIVLEHGTDRSLYAHAAQILVQPGDRVEAGQTIGTVGTTGRTTGAHLHFETLTAGQPIDPKLFIDAKVFGNGNAAQKR